MKKIYLFYDPPIAVLLYLQKKNEPINYKDRSL